MTTINDIADLVRVLRENPEWLDTLRGVLISDDLGTVPASLKEIDRRLASLEAQLGDVKTELSTVGGRVSNLTGDDYESFAARYAPRRMNLADTIASITLTYQDRRHNLLWLGELATNAMLQGRITQDEADDLSSPGPGLHLDTHDTERARRRATILARAQGLAVSAFTIGAAITDEARELGGQVGVTHIHLEQPEQE
ncbi:hypothetical protein GBAR_LOCUS4280 [Geodia barretti]|uniref:Uncharacterized protein n=1 Tax=Geodia barretti TaxID=519541 RepID=A0AA35R788_GEOBA|nr:hypothetical protein GBAR_LOCUS4280 [Geodia barretti]